MKALVLGRVLPALDRVGGALAVVAAAMIIGLVAVMLFEVVARRFFNAPTIWANDITYMTNGTLFLLGAAYTLRRNQHVRIDFLSTRLPLRAQHAANLAFYLIVFLPALALTVQSCVSKALRAYERGTTENMSVWEPVVWPFLTGIAIGVTGLTLQVAVEAVRHGYGVADPASVSPPGEVDRDRVAQAPAEAAG